jgi:hypothetical protein
MDNQLIIDTALVILWYIGAVWIMSIPARKKAKKQWTK